MAILTFYIYKNNKTIKIYYAYNSTVICLAQCHSGVFK